MKSIATLLGWIAIGAIVTIAGQHVWKQFKTDNPQRSEEVSQNVKDVIKKGAETVKETAQAVVDKTDAEDITADGPNATEAPVEKTESVEDTVAAEPAGQVDSESKAVFPSLGPATPIEGSVDTRTADEKKEDAITERFYKLAADKPDAKIIEKTEQAEKETAADYQTRQEVFSRQEDILLERQMRIVDELAEE